MSVTLAILGACTSGASPAPQTTAATVTAPPAPDPSEPAVSTSTTLPSPEAEPNQDIRTIVPGVLTIGTEALTPPWYVGSTPASVTAGFEFDMAKAMAARLGIPSVQVIVTPLVTLLSGQDCKCDLMLSEALVTDNRARTADFTEPYLTVDQAVLVRSGVSMANVEQGRSLRWGVALKNSAGVDVLAKRVKPTTAPLTLVDESDGIQRVADGRLDAMIMDTPNGPRRRGGKPGARRRRSDADRPVVRGRVGTRVAEHRGAERCDRQHPRRRHDRALPPPLLRREPRRRPRDPFVTTPRAGLLVSLVGPGPTRPDSP